MYRRKVELDFMKTASLLFIASASLRMVTDQGYFTHFLAFFLMGCGLGFLSATLFEMLGEIVESRRKVKMRAEFYDYCKKNMDEIK